MGVAPREPRIHRKQPILRAFTLSNATFMFFFVVQAVLMVFLSHHLQLEPAIIGLIFTSGGVAAVISAVAAADR